MTVCIMAVARAPSGRQKIILCTDWAGTSGVGRAETTLKLRIVHRRFRCLTAGNEGDILRFVALLRRAFSSAETIDESTLLPLVQNVVLERKREKLEEYTQTQYGLSYADYLHHAKTFWLDDMRRTDTLEMRDINLGSEFIIGGYDDSDIPQIIRVDIAGKVSFREEYATIGDGGFLASAVLTQREYTDVDSLNRAVYFVWEAKKYAEKMPTVGKKTLLRILQPDGDTEALTGEGARTLGEFYTKYGPQTVPQDLDFPKATFVLDQLFGAKEDGPALSETVDPNVRPPAPEQPD